LLYGCTQVCNDKAREWQALKDKPLPAVWQQASTSWQRAVQPLMELMGGGRYHTGLQVSLLPLACPHSRRASMEDQAVDSSPPPWPQDIARFIRNTHTHLLEKDAAACGAVLGVAPTAASKDALLVDYFGARLPAVFVLLLWTQC
jgi:hypothetical protein